MLLSSDWVGFSKIFSLHGDNGRYVVMARSLDAAS